MTCMQLHEKHSGVDVAMLQHLRQTSSGALGVSHHHALGILASKEKGGGDGRAGVCSLRDLLCVLLHVLLQEVDSQDPLVTYVF